MSNTVKYAIVGSGALAIVVVLLLRLRYHAKGAGRVRSQLRDDNAEVRIAALRSIGARDLTEFIDELRPLLQTEHDPSVLDCLMVEILTSSTSHVSTRKMVELRSWAIERQNRVHGGRLPEQPGRTSFQPTPMTSPATVQATPTSKARQKVTQPTERRVEGVRSVHHAEIEDVELWTPEPQQPLPVLTVAAPPVAGVGHPDDQPAAIGVNAVAEAAPGASLGDEQSSDAKDANDDTVKVADAVEEAPVPFGDAAAVISLALGDAQREAEAIDSAARREAAAVALAAEHEAAAVAEDAQREAEVLAREAELAARELTEAAAREAQAHREEAALHVAALTTDAEDDAEARTEAVGEELDRDGRDSSVLAAMVEEAEAEADALIEAARLASMDLVEKSRRDAEVILAEAAAERRVLLDAAEVQVATVEAQAAVERRQLLDATYEQCLQLLEQLPNGAQLSSEDARSLLDAWRKEAVAGAPRLATTQREPLSATVVGDPEHLVVIVRSPAEIARAEQKAAAKAKKKAKKKAKRARERARALAKAEAKAAAAAKAAEEALARAEAEATREALTEVEAPVAATLGVDDHGATEELPEAAEPVNPLALPAQVIGGGAFGPLSLAPLDD